MFAQQSSAMQSEAVCLYFDYLPHPIAEVFHVVFAAISRSLSSICLALVVPRAMPWRLEELYVIAFFLVMLNLINYYHNFHGRASTILL